MKYEVAHTPSCIFSSKKPSLLGNIPASKFQMMKNKLSNTLNIEKGNGDIYGKPDINSHAINQYTLGDDKTIEDLYIMYEILGEGSTAVVKRAIRKADGMEVALKCVRTSDIEMLIIIWREYELQASISHQCIVKALDLHYDKRHSKIYIVLEYVYGTTLLKLMGANKRLDELKCMRIYTQISEALNHLHLKGIIHRDLQPANILYSDGIAKIADFSVATRAKEVMYSMEGRCEYMAPEMLNGKGYNLTADYWSLGILLCVMATGINPCNKGQLINFTDVSNYQNLSAKLKEMISTLLCFDPIKRKCLYQSN